MNGYEKAEYDFKAIKETVKNSLIIHKDILLPIGIYKCEYCPRCGNKLDWSE